MKAKLAKYRTQLLEPSGKKGEKGEGFEVLKSGDARVAMIGFPSVGKSTLLSSITKTESEQASYEFTTLTCIPGNTEYHPECLTERIHLSFSTHSQIIHKSLTTRS